MGQGCLSGERRPGQGELVRRLLFSDECGLRVLWNSMKLASCILAWLTKS
jgi:hypothetical protein